MANFIREFLEVFCFSSAYLNADNPLCSAVCARREAFLSICLEHSSTYIQISLSCGSDLVRQRLACAQSSSHRDFMLKLHLMGRVKLNVEH